METLVFQHFIRTFFLVSRWHLITVCTPGEWGKHSAPGLSYKDTHPIHEGLLVPDLITHLKYPSIGGYEYEFNLVDDR